MGSTKAPVLPKSFEAVTQKIPILDLQQEQQTEAVNTSAYMGQITHPELLVLSPGSTLFMLEQNTSRF